MSSKERNRLQESSIVHPSVTLPNDVWHKILLYVDVVTVMKCRMLSLQFHQVTYDVLRRFKNVFTTNLFSDVKGTPRYEDVVNTLNILPKMTELTIRIPNVVFQYDIGDAFCQSHTSNTLKRVVFYGAHLYADHLVQFVQRCPNLQHLSLCNHDSIDDQLCASLIAYCKQYNAQRGTRRFRDMDLYFVRYVGKATVTALLSGQVAHSVAIVGLNQLDHVQFAARKYSTPVNTDLCSNNGAMSRVVLQSNHHLRRFTMNTGGEERGGGGGDLEALEIWRCPLYMFKICGMEGSNALNLRRLKLCYSRWLSTIKCDMRCTNAFKNLEELDLTGSDSLLPVVFDQLFKLGGGDGSHKMQRLRTLILCETLVRNLVLVGYDQLAFIDVSDCSVLSTIVIDNCMQLRTLQINGNSISLRNVNIRVKATCLVHDVPENWITPCAVDPDQVQYLFAV